MSKTPLFDAAINAIFENLAPHERTCKECSSFFKIEAADIELLKKLRVPPPVLCYPCKRRRRLAFLNYTSLYKRKCDVPGHSEDMISSIPVGAGVSVYDYAYWQTFLWEPFSYGVDPSSGSHAEHFLNLLRRVPNVALTRHTGSVGSDYTLYGFNFKNCYYTFGGATSENTNYSNWAKDCKDCLDLLMTSDAQLTSNAVSTRGSYKSNYVYFSYDCLESDFLYDCRNVSNSYACVNLRNKKYCWWNEQLTKDEYEKRRSEINLGDRNVLSRELKKFKEFVKTQPVRAVRNDKSENVVGNYITNSKNCYMVVRGIECENVRYADYGVRITDGMHMAVSANGDLLYETSAVSANCSNVKFSFNGRTLIDSEFTANCRTSKNLFMCIGLENKEFCILNKQYTEEEYWPIVDDIKVKMLEAGEYGEFFPISSSPYAYNGSLAQVVYPLTPNEAQARGYFWYEESLQQLGVLLPKPIADLPSNIKDINDDILDTAIQGVEGKAFRIIKADLDFYRSQNLSIPEKHPYNRMLDRFRDMNNLRLEEEVCSSCGVKTLSAYKKSDGYTVLCDSCFNAQLG